MPKHGVGLRNVAARLAHLYPQQHSFSAGPDAHGRYQVTLRLPLQRDTDSAQQRAGMTPAGGDTPA